MAFLSIPNVRVSGISACVPSQEEPCSSLSLFDDEESFLFSKTTGVVSRRVAPRNICSSDLCLKAADVLLANLKWERLVDCLVFVTQTPDYQIPSTSPILQKRLNLSDDCMTLDISLGCSGYVYGLSVLASLMSHGHLKKGLLLSGDTLFNSIERSSPDSCRSKTCSQNDKSTYPLFGDAGTATALEYIEGTECISFNLKSDGSGSDVIKIRDGGYRNSVAVSSFTDKEVGIGISRNNLQLQLEGMDVFTFGISKAPSCINELTKFFNLNPDQIDYYTFHQANKFMNEKIRKKLKIPEDKVPSSIANFGNTSCASIPLTMVTEIKEDLKGKSLSHIICGFGVGLSWGSAYFKTDHIVCPDLIEI